ncbi:MAG TPA: ATP-binding protein, partial [Verrucomicrobiota bacterium]|nr:ATP-binding protein [Verrucomicrobiota bacterium]
RRCLVSSARRTRAASPASLVEQQARAQAERANRPNDIRLDLKDVPVQMSDEYLGKVVGELVQNAFKFSQPGTIVDVELSGAGEHVVLVVTDRGRGLSPEQITKIGAYMQFDRKMHEQQGLGLGLTICKRLVELHGGTLSIQSEVGRGTTVTVKLPRASRQ